MLRSTGTWRREGRMRKKSVLEEAAEVVNGKRKEDYGEPVECLTRIGEMWGLVMGLEEPIQAEVVAMMMVGLKLVREANRHGRDNLVDMAGYVEIADVAWGRE